MVMNVALAKTNGKHDIDQLNALSNAQQDGFKGRIDQSNDLNQIQQIEMRLRHLIVQWINCQRNHWQ